MRVTKVLFIFFIYSLLFGNILRFQFSNTIGVTFSDLIIGVLFLQWVGLLIIRKVFIKKNSLLVPFLLFIFCCVLSLFVNWYRYTSSELFVSFLYLIRFFVYGSLVFIPLNFDNKFKQTVFTTLFSVGAIFVVTGFIQYFFYNDLRNLYYLGWDEHLLRMFSSFLDPNFTSVFLVLYFIFLLHHFYKEQRRKLQVLEITAMMGTLIAIALTYSRTGYIMFFTCLVLSLVLIKRIRWILVFFFIAIGIYFLTPHNSKVENLNLFRTASSEARIETYKNATKIISDNPIFGIGFNSYRYAQNQYGFLDLETKFSSHADAGTDNSFLFVLATTGIIGAIMYCYLWYKIIKNAVNVNKHNFKNSILVSIIGLFVSAFFINSLFYTFIMSWLWILVGLSLSKANT